MYSSLMALPMPKFLEDVKNQSKLPYIRIFVKAMALLRLMFVWH